MKTLLQLARDKIAQDLLTNHRSTDELVKVLPVELLEKVAAAFRKKLVEDAIRSGDLEKLKRSLDALAEYVARLERKWAEYGKQLLAFAANVDQLRKKMTASDYPEGEVKKDAEAFKVLERDFAAIEDRRKKMVVLIGKLRVFITALDKVLDQMMESRTPGTQPLMDALRHATDRFERLLDRLHEVVLDRVDKAERQMAKIKADLKKRQA